MAVEIVKLQFVGGEIPCLEYALEQVIEQLEVTGQDQHSHMYRYMLARAKAANRELV
jgi:hypothetical protein